MALYETSGSDAVEAGNWHQVSPYDKGRTHVPLQVDISVGTATVEVQGRNGPGDNPGILKTVVDTDTQPALFMIAAFPQMRVNVTAASGATIRVSIGDSELTDLGA